MQNQPPTPPHNDTHADQAEKAPPGFHDHNPEGLWVCTGNCKWKDYHFYSVCTTCGYDDIGFDH